MAIASPGIGSNLDVNGIVSQLMTIERQPINDLVKKEASFQAKLTAYGSLRGALSSFQSSVSALNSPLKFTSIKASVGDSAIATASASSIAASGTYNLEVTSLARAQSLVSGAFTNVTDAVGTGQLTFQFYDTSTGTVNSSMPATTVTIDSAHNSLAGVRDAVNSANAGVTATIINDGTGNKLVFTSNSTGTANSLKISVTDNDGNNTDNSGLSQLAYDPAGSAGAGKNLTQSQAAQNAVLKVNGLTVTKSSNTVTDAIQGVTLNLLSTTTAPTTVSVARDSSSVSSLVDSFVKAYNDLNKTIGDLTSYDPSTKQAGLLQGDSTTRNIQQRIRSLLGNSIMGVDGSMTNLSAIGVSFQKDGSLALDTTKLQNALNSNPDSVTGLFAAFGKSSDSLVSYISSTTKTQPGSYGLDVTQIATQGKAVGSQAATQGYALGAASVGAGVTITAGVNDALSMTVDGQAVAVTLTAGSYTASALATEVQNQLNAALTGGKSVTASESGGVLSVLSNSTGASSTISGIGGSSVSTIFGGTPTATTAVKITSAINDSLSLQVDGISASVTLGAGVYTTAALTAEIQSKINGASAFSGNGISVAVAYSSGAYTITSNRYGSASSVQNMAGNALSTVMGGTPVSTTGLDVAGTINGLSATGSGQYLTGSGGGVAGLQIQVTGGSTGYRGTVNFTQGFAYQLDQLVGDMLASDGPLSGRTNGINNSIDDLNKQMQTLQNRMTDTEARYRQQFTALDQMIGKMKQTSDYLAQQLANLPKVG